ncbi:Gfo/Idh/MocA family protein [Polymorphobacter fuscus]|uniref:Gfo/Idh/MocA family oxidoreductase n=1 Tax=Sandarakinorhabdus fusca TaxID=1439888 RepID=A0A7C9GNT6_9SPHN|nr:Gfo/Idh/MocA family oxidoreductase [Polymorphobacter fuscus]KAB7647705.1 Gfo/Idh/MocA family oxidoreductase [Polymorphobacter fuscus]MQT16997.1 gfo/Idh/MocA family oxidoreductase [Polymorphobacter fuscus]NJC09012.1 putative dehydrogenase [Polymorphobacter fuscus]
MDGSGISRRGFIEQARDTAIVTLAATAAPASVFAQTTGKVSARGRPMPDAVTLPSGPPRAPQPGSVGYAIVGLGDYALNQMMPRFSRSARSHIAALVSGNPEKLRRVGDAYGVPADARYSYEQYDRIAADPRIDAVYIVLPSGLHADYAVRAFKAGKHVLCEKPMALNSADCERMIAAGQRANRRLMIAYRVHFEPHNIEAMALMRRGAAGNIRFLRTEQLSRTDPASRPAENWRIDRALAGGGPLEDYGIYGLQAALYLADEMPESVAATTYRPANDPRFTQVFASVASQLRFPSGAIAQLMTSYDSNGSNLVHVRGDTGALIMDPATGYSGHKMRLEGRERRDIALGDPTVQFARQLDNFTDAIRDGATIRTPDEMGLRDVRLFEAIYAAAETGKTVPLRPDGRMRL